MTCASIPFHRPLPGDEAIRAARSSANRGNALKGNTVDLDSYRQEQPAQLPVQKLPPSLECGKAAHAG